ncbi:MAG: diaminopimelate decarboxylase [Oscillatoria sp. SIO1A7]|nr:diaminopimelate decarboxylase [Oscillatoria sp. SIO1A7]
MVSTQAPPVENSGRQYLPSPIGKFKSISPNQQLFPLTTTVNDRDHMEIGGCDVVNLVEEFGSPLYILDEETLRTACRQYRDALAREYPGQALALYASKAWSCLAVCAIAASEGFGIDVVTEGEMQTAFKAGISPANIYFHGNNKSRAELDLAITSGCTVVADNWLELQTLAEISKTAREPIRIMLRMTPGIECHTHEYIRTGHIDSKFGFDPDQIDEVFSFISQQPGLSCTGLHAHIGSQIFELQPHADLGEVLARWFEKSASYGLEIKELNVGGGLGIRYTEADDPPSIEEWVKVVSSGIVKACEARNLPLPKLLCEPGRSLVGSACVTAYSAGAQKTIPGIRTYLSVDGGMSDNPRPITYQSLYRVVLASQMGAPLTETVTIAGKHCESGDVLIKDARLPKIETGDILVISSTGAYNASMASNYNRVSRPAAVLVGNGSADIILERETYEDLIRKDRLPERLIADS